MDRNDFHGLEELEMELTTPLAEHVCLSGTLSSTDWKPLMTLPRFSVLEAHHHFPQSAL